MPFVLPTLLPAIVGSLLVRFVIEKPQASEREREAEGGGIMSSEEYAERQYTSHAPATPLFTRRNLVTLGYICCVPGLPDDAFLFGRSFCASINQGKRANIPAEGQPRGKLPHYHDRHNPVRDGCVLLLEDTRSCLQREF